MPFHNTVGCCMYQEITPLAMLGSHLLVTGYSAVSFNSG